MLDDGRAVPVVVTRHPRAKRFILRVTGGTIKVTIPTKGSARQALAWVGTRKAFVEAELAAAPAAKPFVPGVSYPVLGRSRRFVVEGSGLPSVEDDRVRVPYRAEAEPGPAFERAIRRAVREAAESDLSRYWEELGKKPGRLTIRAMRGRWGSCGAEGQTSINWRLAFAPREVLRYVAAHEAAHRVEPNHAAAFWRVCEGLDPDFAVHDRWLSEHGRELFAYGRSS